MNMVEGKPMFVWNISSLQRHLPAGTRFVILHNRVLGQYGFPRMVKWWFPELDVEFVEIPYLTRGAAETCFVGVNEWLRKQHREHVDEPVIFCDNDLALTEPVHIPTRVLADPFVLVQHNTEAKAVYSYVRPVGTVFDTEGAAFETADIREKKKISDWICAGLYGFPSVHFALEQFQHLLSEHKQSLPATLDGSSQPAEYFLSGVYTALLVRQVRVFSVIVRGVAILGTPANVARDGSRLLAESTVKTEGAPSAHTPLNKPLRVVFDLDNTLVTYPVVKGDYSTVLPIEHTIAWARQMRRDGHTIIIHTARRMGTHHGNVGRVIADIAQVTFETLARFDIPYDEIVFGKPLGDLYIDDRAVNPWDPHALQAMGFYSHPQVIHTPQGSSGTPFLKCTDHNRHSLDPQGQVIEKVGPTDAMRGEAYFYDRIRTDALLKPLAPLFPKLMEVHSDETPPAGGQTTLKLQYIKGVPLSMIYEYSLLSAELFEQVLASVRSLHHVFLATPAATTDLIYQNYVTKMRERFEKHPEHYAFVPAAEASHVFNTLVAGLEAYLASSRVRQTYCIHGDCWFANIIISGGGAEQDAVKFIDMKGKLHQTLTTSGDPAYDWAKLYQSIVGFDRIVLYGNPAPMAWQEEQKHRLLEQLRKNIESQGFAWSDIRLIAAALMFGTFWAVHGMLDEVAKRQLWQLITAELEQTSGVLGIAEGF